MTDGTGERFDGVKKSGHDSAVDDRIAAHCERFAISPLEAVKSYAALARRQWLKRLLAHAVLFRRTIEVPGDVVELGVFRGAGLFTWANLLETWSVANRTKTVWGFENWTGFGGFSPEDGPAVEAAHKVEGGFSPAAYRDELLSAIEIFDSDRFIPQKPRIRLVDGDIEETVPRFVRDNPGVRLSLVHFDCDLYAPTRVALAHFWPILSRGGLFLFDEYGIPDWAGETRAVDEFLADKPGLVLRSLDWNNTPAAYLVKP